jgi:hypothetical protein
MLRKLWRIGKWTLATTLVLLVAVVIFLHTPWGRSFLRGRIEAALQSDFPGSTVGSVRGSVFTTLEVTDLHIAGIGGKPFVTVGYAKIDVGLMPLVTKHVRIDRLELDDVFVDPAAQPPANPSAVPSPRSWSIAVWGVAVHRAHIVLRDNDLTNVEVYGAVFAPAGGTLTAIVGTTGTWRGDGFNASAYARVGDTIEIPLAHVGLASGSVDVLGARSGDTPTGEAIAQVTPALVKLFTDRDVPQLYVMAHARGAGGIAIETGAADLVVRLLGVVDLKKQQARGVITAAIPAYGMVALAIDGDLTHARGIISADLLRDGHHARELVAIGATHDAAWILGSMASDLAHGRATIRGEVVRKGVVFELQKSTISAHATGLDVAIGGGDRARLGYAQADFSAIGPVWPEMRVRLDGTLESSGLLYGAFGAGTASLRMTGVYGDKTGAAGSFRVAVGQAMKRGKLLGSATVNARATVGIDGTITAVVDDHKVTTATGGVWSGSGGKVLVVPEQFAVRELKTGDGTGTVTANATIGRLTGDLAADVDAKNVALANLAPGLSGSVAASAHVTKKSGRWDATANITAKSIVLAPDRPKLDGSVALAVHGRHINVTTTASAADIGEIRLLGDLDGPADLTDVAAWKRVERKSLKSIALDFVDVQLARADQRLSGVVAGEVALTATDSHGTVHLRDFHTKRGIVEGDVTFSGDHGVIDAGIAAQLVGIAAATGVVRAQLPAHLFDPAAWKTLGSGALLGGTLQARNVAITPEVVAKLGGTSPYHGKLDVDMELGARAASAGVKLDVKGLAGGVIKQAIDTHLEASLDTTGANASASIKTGSVPLLALDAHAPLTLGELLAGHFRTASLAGTIALAQLPAVGAPPPTVPAKALLAVFGRRDVSAGTLTGTIQLGGTVGTPTAVVALDAANITIPASVEGRKPAKLTDLALHAHWTGVEGDLDLLGHEEGAGLVHVTARGRPDQLALLEASFEASKLDVAPFTAFVPGKIGAAKGSLDAELKLKGLDPDTGDLKGQLQLHNGRLPLHDLIGTLRSAELDVQIANHQIISKLKAKLGKGDVDGTSTIEMTGSTPKTADITLALRQISLIRAYQPSIDATITAKLVHGDKWTGDVAITNAHVLVPQRGGVALLDSAMPNDMLFVDGDAPKVSSLLERPPPSEPWLVTNVTLGPTTVDVEDAQYQVLGGISGSFILSYGGDEIGLDGAIDAQRGDIQLLGQRSQLDHGSVVFDGTIDPLLNIRVVRDLDDMSVTCEVGGRLSKPEVQFSSDAAGYSQGDLLAFFVGGQPGGARGEVGQAAAAAAAGYASSLVSKQINDKLLKKFKVKLDFHYDPATSSNSEGIGFSYWINRNLFIEGREHPEARPDENANEVVGEYHLSNNTIWQGDIGDRGYAGSDLVHRWHW